MANECFFSSNHNAGRDSSGRNISVHCQVCGSYILDEGAFDDFGSMQYSKEQKSIIKRAKKVLLVPLALKILHNS